MKSGPEGDLNKRGGRARQALNAAVAALAIANATPADAAGARAHHERAGITHQSLQEAGKPRSFEQMTKDYKAAREHVKRSQDPHGIFSLEYYLPESKKVVDIGRFNTQGYRLVEEGGLLDVMNHLGFKNFSDFAKMFNETFAQREQRAKDLLMSGGQEVDVKFTNGEDIPIGDTVFKNIRLAVEIFVTDKLLRQPMGDSIDLAGQRFSVEAMHKKLPGISAREMLFFPNEAENLSIFLKHLPDRVPRFESGSFTIPKAEDLLKMYTYVDEDAHGAKRYELLFERGKGGELGRAFDHGPHGAIDKELNNFLHGSPPYESQHDANRNFVGENADNEPAEDGLGKGFNTDYYVYEGG